MPQFFYKAKKGPKDIVSGYMTADSVADTVAKLALSGQIPFEIKPARANEAQVPINSARKVFRSTQTPVMLVALTRQLADLLNAGIPVLRSFELLSKQQQFPTMIQVCQQIVLSLKQGESLSRSLSAHPRVFNGLYVNTVKAAETSGQLPVVFERLAQFLENDLLMRSKVKSSLLYPTVIFIVGILTIFVLMSFVLPRLVSMYEDFDTQLPLLTQVVMAMSQFSANYWWGMAGLVLAAVAGLKKFLATQKGRIWKDGFVFKVPLLKSYIEHVQLSRFARTLGMLLESGVPVVAALESVAAVVDNTLMENEIRMMAIKVKEGQSLANAVRLSRIFPDIAYDLIAIGQESGKLEMGLYKLASSVERQANEQAQAFVTVLGPAVLVVVVSIVGVMIVSILLPMLQMNLIIH